MLIAGLRTICRQRFHNIIWNIKTSRHMRGFSMRVPYMKALCWPRNAVRQTTTAVGIQDPVASWENPSSFLPPSPLLSLNTPTSNSNSIRRSLSPSPPPNFYFSLCVYNLYLYTRMKYSTETFFLGLTLFVMLDQSKSFERPYRGITFLDNFRAR